MNEDEEPIELKCERCGSQSLPGDRVFEYRFRVIGRCLKLCEECRANLLSHIRQYVSKGP